MGDDLRGIKSQNMHSLVQSMGRERLAKSDSAQNIAAQFIVVIAILILILVYLFWAFGAHNVGHIAWWLLWIAVASLVIFRCALVLTPKPTASANQRTMRRNAPAQLPVYTVLVPLYDEANVVPQLICALDGLDYPRHLLDIQLLIEADDAPTQRAAERALAKRALKECAPGESYLAEQTHPYRITIIAPEGYTPEGFLGVPRTKPRALNVGLAQARGSFVAVYDAEDRPHPAQLRAALDAFASGGDTLAAVQAPLAWWNGQENLLTAQFALEYAVQFHVVLPALARWGWALPLGGTSNHFRRAPLEAVGAWDPYNVTEDADLGLRLAAQGWRTGVIAPGTDEEAVNALRPWVRQRSRWMRGFMQTALVRLRQPAALVRGGGWGALASLCLTVIAPVITGTAHGLALLVTAALVLTSLITQTPIPTPPAWALGLMAASYTSSILALTCGAVRSRQLSLLPHILFTPAYWVIHAPAVCLAVWRLTTTPHIWEKTAHGVARKADDHWHPAPGE